MAGIYSAKRDNAKKGKQDKSDSSFEQKGKPEKPMSFS